MLTKMAKDFKKNPKWRIFAQIWSHWREAKCEETLVYVIERAGPT